MQCPFCNNQETQVRDSRPTEENSAIRRRRQCLACGGRFTTFERIQMRDLTVVKRSGKRAPFDRDKLMRSVDISVRKRNIDPDVIERMVTGIVRQLESTGETDIPSNLIGSLIMAALREVDMVSYVRFASVYKNFREVKDFEDFVGELGNPSEIIRED
jgi:transcriptional repressor NrdR